MKFVSVINLNSSVALAEQSADDFVIPDGTLVAGDNTIEISVVSGSSGDSFLSPNFVYDSIELI